MKWSGLLSEVRISLFVIVNSFAPSHGLRFTHLRLENWRNFKAVDVDLAQRVFLVGPNGSGKSNFLDAFRSPRDLASVGGGLQYAVQRRGGVSRIRSLAARRPSDVALAVGVGSDDELDDWRYELSFTQDPRGRALLKREVVTRRGEVIHERPREEDEADPERRTQTTLEQVNVNRRPRGRSPRPLARHPAPPRPGAGARPPGRCDPGALRAPPPAPEAAGRRGFRLGRASSRPRRWPGGRRPVLVP
jgi:hypothetical protein